jgi:hypothetical protein
MSTASTTVEAVDLVDMIEDRLYSMLLDVSEYEAVIWFGSLSETTLREE